MTELNDHDLRTIKKFVSHPNGLGYVLDYSNNEFASWFDRNWSINIESEKYLAKGESKGNRLLEFCLLEPSNLVVPVLEKLYAEANDLGVTSSEVVTKQDIKNYLELISNISSIDDGDNDYGPSDAVSSALLVENAQRNSHSILLFASATIESLNEYREIVESDNMLAVENLELRDKLLKLINAVIDHLEALLALLPSIANMEPDVGDQGLSNWTKRYMDGALPKLQDYVAPEALGRTSVPIGVILMCGGIGSLLTGFSPIGFGAGSYVGKLITGEMKSGSAADQLAKQLHDN